MNKEEISRLVMSVFERNEVVMQSEWDIIADDIADLVAQSLTPQSSVSDEAIALLGALSEQTEQTNFRWQWVKGEARSVLNKLTAVKEGELMCCSGCGHIKGYPLKSKTAYACCPESNANVPVSQMISELWQQAYSTPTKEQELVREIWKRWSISDPEEFNEYMANLERTFAPTKQA